MHTNFAPISLPLGAFPYPLFDILQSHFHFIEYPDKKPTCYTQSEFHLSSGTQAPAAEKKESRESPLCPIYRQSGLSKLSIIVFKTGKRFQLEATERKSELDSKDPGKSEP